MSKLILKRAPAVVGIILCLFLTASPFLYLLLIAVNYSVDVPRWDDWLFIPLLEKSCEGTLTINDLLAPHNSHRLFFPRIIILALARATGWNAKYQIAVNILLGGLIYLMLAIKILSLGDGRFKRAVVWLLPVISVIVFSLSQWENWFWGWQIAIYLNVFAVLGGFYLLSRNKLTRLGFAAGAFSGIVATYSFINGLLFWPIGLLLILSLADTKRMKVLGAAIWVVISVSVTYAYLNYPARDLVGQGYRMNFKPFFILQYLAMPLSRHDPLFRTSPITMLLIGAGGLLWLILTIVFLKHYFQVEFGRIAFWLSMALFSIGSAIMTSIGREEYFTSRYTTISSPFWVALVAINFLLYSQFSFRHDPNNLSITVIRYSLIACIIFVASLVTANSYLNTRVWYRMSQDLRHARDRLSSTAMFSETQDLIVLGYDAGKPLLTARQLNILKKRRLSVYRERLCPVNSLPAMNILDNGNDAVYEKWWRLIPFGDEQGKWGYRTRGRERVIIPTRFDHAEPFLNKYAKVGINGKDAFVDTSGRIVFSSLSPVTKELHVVKSSSQLGFLGARPKYGYADRSGRYVIQPDFDDAYDFSEELAPVRVGDKYGYINTKGKIIIEPRFAWAGSFSGGMAPVLVGDREGYIDDHGGMVVPPRFIWADKFSDGLAAVLIDNAWGYIDKKGDMVINPEFEMAWPFSSGFARVEADGKWWYINRKGDTILPKKSIEECTKIPDEGFPHFIDISVFQTSSNIHGYHPEKGLIFNARGWALSRTFHIPEGKYSLQLTAEGPTDLEVPRMMNIVLIPVVKGELKWPHIAEGSIFVARGKHQYPIGPWDIPGGNYKAQIFLLNDPVTYTEAGEIVYDKDFYIAVENISINHH